jgi:hypothetical protein
MAGLASLVLAVLLVTLTWGFGLFAPIPITLGSILLVHPQSAAALWATFLFGGCVAVCFAAALSSVFGVAGMGHLVGPSVALAAASGASGYLSALSLALARRAAKNPLSRV